MCIRDRYGTPEYGRRADGTIDNGNEKSYLGMLYKGEGLSLIHILLLMRTVKQHFLILLLSLKYWIQINQGLFGQIVLL